ncbi:MAG: RlmE family RNA methyltransferase [Candidatus Lokiarchaeota archaeon]|nr:RlmE family RNA methyltransferase [Candidatus Lokiarchaeota archaeon]
MSKDAEEHKKDAAYKKAKREGYRARSAFKLQDIQNRYNIFKRAYYILDLGSAPGSWLQVAKKYAELNLTKYFDKYYHRDHYKIMGVDIKRLTPIEDVKILKMDFTTPEFPIEVNRYFEGEKLDIILSDASINKSGNKFSDQSRQTKLCFKILELTKFLKFKGNFVIKIFQGADFDNFYTRMKRDFMIVKSLKPKSSNKKSNEIYLIGLKKK